MGTFNRREEPMRHCHIANHMFCERDLGSLSAGGEDMESALGTFAR